MAARTLKPSADNYPHSADTDRPALTMAPATHIPESVIGRVLRRQEALTLLVPKNLPHPA
jgi:hypothetical protein